MTVDYDHAKSPHSTRGAAAALAVLLASERRPGSILDVGCGTGTWLRAALDLGIDDVYGVDGQGAAVSKLLFPRERFTLLDLRRRFDLGRRFDLVICLEVAEHLPADAAEPLVESLVMHGDRILFSAACPGQPGQHHINCQWPEWWQDIFNRHGFACADAIRWRMWSSSTIEPWYRQNSFIATRDPATAGREARIKAVVHPDMLTVMRGLGNNLPAAVAERLRAVRSFIKRGR
jgi:SAM-dependent methyltransferase